MTAFFWCWQGCNLGHRRKRETKCPASHVWVVWENTNMKKLCLFKINDTADETLGGSAVRAEHWVHRSRWNSLLALEYTQTLGWWDRCFLLYVSMCVCACVCVDYFACGKTIALIWDWRVGGWALSCQQQQPQSPCKKHVHEQGTHKRMQTHTQTQISPGKPMTALIKCLQHYE